MVSSFSSVSKLLIAIRRFVEVKKVSVNIMMVGEDILNAMSCEPIVNMKTTKFKTSTIWR